MAKFSSHNKNDYSPRISTKIYALRRDGLLDDARQLAEDYLQKNRTDIDVLKAYAWTLIDICKREQQKGNIVDARKISALLSRMHFETNSMSLRKCLLEKYKHLD